MAVYKPPLLTGVALARIIILALFLLLIANRYRIAISPLHFFFAAGLAAILYFLGRKAYHAVWGAFGHDRRL